VKTVVGILLVALTLTAGWSAAEAQMAGRIPRIGYLSGLGDPKNPGAQVEAFRGGLRDLGYIEGKNILVEYRDPEGKGPAVEAELARELVRVNVDLLVVSAFPSIRAAKEATKTIPIVMISGNDPIELGLIDSLARPGGNLTGVSVLARELTGKRLELLKEMVPPLSRFGTVIIQGAINATAVRQHYEIAARALKVEHRAFELSNPDSGLPSVFDAARKARLHALIPIRSGAINRVVPQIAALAIKHRLPTMFERQGAVEVGGLASYTADEVESYRRAAVYVDKILKGAKPADLPVEQPTKFEFVINLKTAKQIGLTIPQSVLFRADKVIK
jgi:putative tryptophan/tyrosine transport system substrate-binding protein